MANPEHLHIHGRGVEAWNSWRSENPDVGADLRDVNLDGAYFYDADLSNANFSNASLANAYFAGANLEGANLYKANLEGADFEGANVRHAELSFANLNNAYLCRADLSHAILSNTVFSPFSLDGALGLEAVNHQGRSVVHTATLDRIAAELSKDPANRGAVETFLRGAGVSEPIMDAFAMMIANPIEFYSCFISYSHRDKSFARRLYEALQARGIRCWLDEHALLPGDDIKDQIDRGIRIWDKVLLCCSEDSLRSYWVEDEVDKAIEKELQLRKDRGSKVHAIIPLDLDGYLFKGWQDGRGTMIRKRLAADFKGWASDNAKFEAQLERVLLALKTERDAEPVPKL